MKKKLMTLAVALGLSLAMLTGCSKPTVESLVDGMFDSEIESQTAEIETDIKLSPTAQGVSIDITAGGDFEMQVSGMNGKGAQTRYVDGTVTVKVPVGNIDEKLGFEAYSVVDDGTVASYACVDDGEWYMGELDDVWDQDAFDETIEELKDVLKENGELAEDTEKVEGEECYVITATIEGRDFVDIFKPMQGIIDDSINTAIDNAVDGAMEAAGVSMSVDIDIDLDMISWLKYCSADVTCYISKDTGYLVKTEIDMSDTDIYGMTEQMMRDVVGTLEQALKDVGQEDTLDGAQDAIDRLVDMIEDISISKFYISVVFSDVNDTEVEVPDDVIDDAVDIYGAEAIGDLMGNMGNDPMDDPIEEPPVQQDPVGTDEWYHGNSFTLNKCDESDEFLCEVKIPNGFTYDEDISSPEFGIAFLNRTDDEGGILVYNEAYEPTYTGLLEGELDGSLYEDYEDYEIETKVIGTAFGGSDVLLVTETYTYSGYDMEGTYICIKYNDGGFAEFLTVECTYMFDLDEWTDDDFLDLAVSMFGR